MPCRFIRRGPRRRFPIRRRLLIQRDSFVLLPLQRQQPRRLGVLHRLARRHDHRLRSRIARLVHFGLPQQTGGAVIGVLRILIRVGNLRDGDGVLRLQQLQRKFLIGFYRMVFGGRSHRCVGAARQQIVFHAGLFDLALRVVADDVLHHHHVARLADVEVRFGGHDERESLQVRGHIQMRVSVIQHHFTQILRATLRRNRPQHVSQIFGTVLRSRQQLVHFRFHFDVAGPAVHVGMSGGVRREWRAAQIHLGPTAAMTIADGIRGALYHGDAKDRLAAAGGWRRGSLCPKPYS